MNTLSKYVAKVFSLIGGIFSSTPEEMLVFTSAIIHLKDMYIAEKYDKQVVLRQTCGKVTATVYVSLLDSLFISASVTHK